MNIIDNFQWASHQPLIHAVMELYMPKFVLEVGMGDYSTPIFLKYKLKFLGVENEKDWIERLKIKYQGIDIIHHDLKDLDTGTCPFDLTEQKKSEIIEFYKNLDFPYIKPNLLFVDNHLPCRIFAINELGDEFDLIIYHDSQPETIIIHSYDLINLKGFNKYSLTSSDPWTTLLVRKEIDKGFDDLNRTIIPHILNYIKIRFGFPIELIKDSEL
jgi:hypothetical protein